MIDDQLGGHLSGINEEYTEYLKKIGLNRQETLAYTGLLSIKTGTIADIANVARAPRTSVKRALQSLINMGLVAKISDNKRIRYIAESPQKIQILLEEKELSLNKTLKELSHLKGILPEMASLISQAINKSKLGAEFNVKYYEGKKGFIDAHNRTLECKEKMLYFVSNMDYWKQVFTDDYAYKYYVPVRIKRKIYAKTLAIKSKLAQSIRQQDKKYYREMRFLPAGLTFRPTVIAYDDEVLVMIATQSFYAILIKNESLAVMIKNMFNLMWNICEPPKNQ